MRAVILADSDLEALAGFVMDSVRAGVEISTHAEAVVRGLLAEARRTSPSIEAVDLSTSNGDTENAVREPWLLPVDETARLLGIGETMLRELDGLSPVRIGRRVLYRRSDIENYLEALAHGT